MAEKNKEKVDNPWDSANPLSKLLFLWVIPFLSSNLNIHEIFGAPKKYRSKVLVEETIRLWENECFKAKTDKRRPKLIWVLLASHWKKLVIAFTTTVICECSLRILPALVLGRFVNSFNVVSSQRKDQYLYAIIICVAPFINNLLLYTAVWSVQRIGFTTRIGLSSLVFRKALRMPQSTCKQTLGRLLNLLSNDMGRFDYNSYISMTVLVAPIQLCVLMYFLYNTLGVSALVGVTIVIMGTPAQYFNGVLSRRYRHNIAKHTDERGRIMNEIVLAIAVIKMYAWEKPFSTVIRTVRRLEVQALKKQAYLKGLANLIFPVSLKMTPYMTIVVIVIMGDEMNAGKIFLALAIYNILCNSMFYQFPYAITWISELSSSMNRIEEFLLAEEKQQYVGYECTSSSQNVCIPEIDMKNVSARWDDNSFALNGVNIHASGNKIIFVIGSFGCGKTSLLNAIISELKLSNGNCKINGRISYCSQEPWIFNGSVRQNIIFGTPFNESRYEDITSKCALLEDFKQLPHGDQSVVGERGIMLSGGQKARVHLARALYRDADIYLLDDPLSAVDSRVGRHIFEKCIREHLNGKLRIIVTHQLQYLQFANHIVVLNKGTVVDQGSYDDVIEMGLDIADLISNETGEIGNTEENVEMCGDIIFPKEVNECNYKEPSETMSEGSVAKSTYWSYFRMGGDMFQFALLICFTIITQILQRSADYWLSYWTTISDREIQNELTYDPKIQNNTSIKILEYSSKEYSYLYTYTSLVGFFIFCCAVKIYLHFNYSLKISTNLHENMFLGIIRAPLKFYDKNPSGRIMNRFVRDCQIFDEMLPLTIYTYMDCFAQLIGTIIIVSIPNYYFLVPCVVTFCLLWSLRSLYIQTSRNAKRVESVAKSPMFTHLSSSIQGISTIRSFGHQERIIGEFDDLQDAHSSAWFIVISTSRAFASWIDQVSGILLTFGIISFLTIDQDASTGNVGLILTSLMAMLSNLQWSVRQGAETEILMTAVERALEYVRLEPEETTFESQNDVQPPEDWPKNGIVQFKNVSLSYNNGENYVLKNINFDIKASEKIGIVGRTGAGKTSIISALFRLTEPEGEIYIDGILINCIGLFELRKKISIIPQDPVLFSGTIRYNLDPFGHFEDIDLLKVVEEVQLKEVIQSLEMQVTDGGSNFSVGERQLLCLARAILRKNKIIVMDEATSSVDPRTDNFIQSTIRSKFSGCSIITIAHRLHTVMDSDRLLVLDNGTIHEFDHPYVLLQNDGMLSSMVKHVSGNEKLKLCQIAQESYLLSNMSRD